MTHDPGLNAKHIMAAVDDSENARRAVRYVGAMAGNLTGGKVTIIHIIQVPPGDFFTSDEERAAWIGKQTDGAERILGAMREELRTAGFDEASIRSTIDAGEYPSVGATILRRAEEQGAGTLVIGRRGISRKEEFLFGSTSDAILHAQKQGVALWVVD
jgi:nucleotide-binding universal stress UspA family protein